MSPASIESRLLQVDVRRHGAHHVVSLQGDLDLSSAPLLEARVADLEGLVSCVIDLHDLEFLDCAGHRALVHLSEELTARGGRLVLTRPSADVAKVLKIVGPDEWEWASGSRGRCLSWSASLSGAAP